MDFECLHSNKVWLFNVSIVSDDRLEADLAIVGKKHKPVADLVSNSGQQLRVYLDEYWQNNPTPVSAVGEVDFKYVYL